MSRARLKGIAMISAGDLMACFVGILLLFMQTEKEKIKEQKEEAKQEVAAAEAQKEEIEAQKQKLEAEIKALRDKKWKLIATQWKLGSSNEPADASLYCFKDGIFESPESVHAMSDAEITAWLKARPKKAKRLFLYVENGANDSLLHAQSVFRASGSFEGNFSLMTLPSDMDVRN